MTVSDSNGAAAFIQGLRLQRQQIQAWARKRLQELESAKLRDTAQAAMAEAATTEPAAPRSRKRL
ncbi:hypothetical protein SAMN05216466_106109 [Paraburkholderia phenazinium]|uniref:Uncharacterized protein n=1 Tax=Paraburkholderia phenazinium TaxID=60549 RepID=A0A1G7YAM3_9BURK|nr:hypothetical protein [Paraburkholderia phenazinium]SDG93528.1 hypothetical protein SAMN05216466_106109 [Paraburkholderia phenazinium]